MEVEGVKEVKRSRGSRRRRGESEVTEEARVETVEVVEPKSEPGVVEVVEPEVVVEEPVVKPTVVTFSEGSFNYEVRYVKGEELLLKRIWQVTQTKRVTHTVTVKLSPELCVSKEVAFETDSVEREEVGRICIRDPEVLRELEQLLEEWVAKIKGVIYSPKIIELRYLINDIIEKVITKSARRLVDITSW